MNASLVSSSSEDEPPVEDNECDSEEAKDASAILLRTLGNEEFIKAKAQFKSYKEIAKEPSPVYNNYSNCVKIL